MGALVAFPTARSCLARRRASAVACCVHFHHAQFDLLKLNKTEPQQRGSEFVELRWAQLSVDGRFVAMKPSPISHHARKYFHVPEGTTRAFTARRFLGTVKFATQTTEDPEIDVRCSLFGQTRSPARSSSRQTLRRSTIQTSRFLLFGTCYPYTPRPQPRKNGPCHWGYYRAPALRHEEVVTHSRQRRRHALQRMRRLFG